MYLWLAERARQKKRQIVNVDPADVEHWDTAKIHKL